MDSSPDSLLHRPLFFRRTPLDRSNAASRISAYIYGNILALTALVPIVTAEKHLGILVVLGTSASTFVAHSFAESVARTVRDQETPTLTDRLRELRNSVPILTSAILPCLVLAAGWLAWLEPRNAQILAEVVILTRIGGIAFVIGRLRGRRPTRTTLLTALLLTLAATLVVIVKIALTH
ncbi:hypothetical protein [Nocardia farcinica]|uniref:Integral membrane protein n=2 Tax=Nocardia farcinica TaxID=37329 RepID=Q5YU77_NOCFA|nr:hypothetical protein [Nocardia farcinica]AXK89174.1 hypothetical protein DXT66_29240 [Nocardia farcinica]MBA4858523.1 hypothetical protein [Nocardia farcinica]MBC9819128.1 hypothetical protein [Nocardia farcinica]MBF6260183.1 hypothetical protein [Nocardia farcinica]MBF6363902.1 hypothetical protein [Nocardia farcinica]